MKRCHFSLIEILAAVAIIAILAGLGIGLATVSSNKKAEAKTEAVIRRLQAALEEVKLKHGYYPQSDSDCLIKYESNPDLDTDKVITADGKKYPARYVNDFQNAFGKEDFLDMVVRTLGNGDLKSRNVYIFVDGWGNPLYYRCPGKKNPESYDLFSTGSDGAAGDDKEGDDPKLLYDVNKSGGNTSYTLKNNNPEFDNKEHDDMGTF